MDPPLSAALQYIYDVQSTLTGDGRHRYDEFCRILKQFRRRNIHSSIVVSTVQTLFQNHPDLLDAFNTFKPRNCSAAAPAAQEPDLTASVDFLNRVRVRFRGGRVYSKFLNCMHAYSRQEMSVSDVCDKVVGLFGNNDDLVDEFVGFLPPSCIRERSKRRIDDQIQTDCDGEFGLQGRRRKKRRVLNSDSSSGSGSGSGSNDDLAATERRRVAAKIIKDMNNDMEDSLCEVDVRIGNLKSSRTSAGYLAELLSDGLVSAADVRVDEHFTPLNLVCIRRLDKKILDYLDRDVVHALPELFEILMKKKEGLEKERVKIMHKWNKFRQSC